MSEETPRPREGLLLPVLIPLGGLAVIGVVLFGFSRILLGISHNAATVTALVVAVTIVMVAGIVAAQKRVGPAAIGSMLGVVTGVALMTGSLAFLIVGPQPEEIEPEVVKLAAPDGASTGGFEPNSMSVPASAPWEIDFDNEEAGVLHNVVIYQADPATDPGQGSLFRGPGITGPATTVYKPPPLPEGSFFFLCEYHPTTMTGTVTSTKGGAAPGPTVVAKDLAFDTAEIRLPEKTPTALRFDNQDSTTHNIAIFKDDSLSDVLFDGQDVVGPAAVTYTVPPLDPGTYYFHCDTHPSMNGSVVVGEGGDGGGPGDGGNGGSPGPQPPDEPTPTEPPPSEPPGGGGGATASISASGLAFSTDALSFPADTGVTVTFDNQEAVLHNVDIFADAAYTESLAKSPDVTGPASVPFDVPPLGAGTYYFRCDYHPTMAGTVSVT